MLVQISNVNQVNIKPQIPVSPPKKNIETDIEPSKTNNIENTMKMLNSSLKSNSNLSEKIMRYM